MTIGSKKELIILFLGDLISLALAFWLHRSLFVDSAGRDFNALVYDILYFGIK